MTRFDQRMRVLALCLLALTLAPFASAQTETELFSFDGNIAAGPKAPLSQGIDGGLYGTTYYGGTGTCFDGAGIGCGVVFKITRRGFKVIYNFQEGGLVHPENQFILGDDGNFYGTASTNTIFRVTPEGSLTTIYTFTGGISGSNPTGIVQGFDGNFYGTTLYGGTPSEFCSSGCGTVFKMTPAGVLTTLYSFCPQDYCPDGENPVGALVQGADGNFYGTAENGGLYKRGTVFKISPRGSFTLLYPFEGNFSQPYPGGLIAATNGNLYGTTETFVYQITPEGDFTNLSGLVGGGNPNLVIQGTDGNLYATTQEGGTYNYGMLLEMPTDGTASDLYNFAGYPDNGAGPFDSLVQATDGMFYGDTFEGGKAACNYGNDSPGCGTIFSLDMGLGPFVAFVRSAGSAGQRFGLLGQGFTGTTSVSLNGTSASFTIKSDTLIVATIPAGATTGYVTVTTPGGTLTSNVEFHVIP